MNLELLISKYLDGDLTPEEDQLLRKIISEEPSAREEFEGAALLHVEMQQDAESIIPPADLVSQTEDMILMKIMNHSVQDSGRPAFFLKMPFGRKLVNVFSVAVMLFAFTIPFRDGAVNLDGKGEGLFSANTATEVDLNLLKELSTEEKVLKTTFKRYSLKNGAIASTAVLKSESRDPIHNSGIAEMADVAPEASFSASEMEFLKTSPTITDAIRNSSSMSQQNANTWAANEGVSAQENSLKDGGYTAFGEKSSKDEVQVSTFLATNVLKNAKASESAIASVSQSVSYGINSNDRVGVELGYTAYTYEGNSVRAVESSTKPGGIVIMGAGAEEKPSQPNDGGAIKPVWSHQEMPYVDQGRMYWGAAFYERQMVRSGNMSVHGRLGVGGSGEGGVAYGRLFGKYDVFPAVSLTVGAESRALVKTPASVENAEVNAALSLMYGLQIRF
jgi:hypothetical protein